MAKQVNTAPSKSKKGDDEEGFKKWYGDWASKHKMNPDPDDKEQHYDYRAAYRQGVKPPNTTAGEHWPSTDKDDKHPNINVGGFNTKTGKRVPGTKQGTEDELRASGWDEESAKRLGRKDDVAKKPYNVTERFQEVARRAKEIGPINTGPSKKPEPLESKESLKTSFDKQFGAFKKGKDRNLPLSTAPKEAKDRAAKQETDFRNSTATKYKNQSAIVNKESDRQAEEINKRIGIHTAPKKKR